MTFPATDGITDRLQALFAYDASSPLIFSSGLFLFLFAGFLLVYSVFRRAGSISPGKLQAYLGAAARNRAKDFLRKQKPLEADLDELTLPDGEGTAPEAELLRRERQMRVKEAIFSMEPVDREIFLRYYYYLQPAPEIAEAMRLTPGAVRTRLSRGRAALKKRLSQEEFLCE